MQQTSGASPSVAASYKYWNGGRKGMGTRRGNASFSLLSPLEDSLAGLLHPQTLTALFPLSSFRSHFSALEWQKKLILCECHSVPAIKMHDLGVL